jgi:hypothetical protein
MCYCRTMGRSGSVVGGSLRRRKALEGIEHNILVGCRIYTYKGVTTSDRYPAPHKKPHSLPDEVAFPHKKLTFTILSAVALSDRKCHPSVQYYAMIYLAQAWCCWY